MQTERRYREEKIRDLLWEMSSLFSELSMMWEYATEEQKQEVYYMDKEDSLESSFAYKAKAVYKLILAYLEEANYQSYLKDFKEKFQPILNDPKKITAGEMTDETAEMVSVLTREYWEFLTPFEFSQESYLDRLLQQTGLTYLERILRSTQVIINHTKANPSSETKVYNEVKFVVRTVFTSSVEPKSGFFKSFKNYNPDILIPELHAAVEYKYADKEQDLKKEIDEISADVRGYDEDTTYQIFYAVFYVTEDYWGIDKFEHVWKEMRFPPNWKGIYVVGKIGS